MYICYMDTFARIHIWIYIGDAGNDQIRCEILIDCYRICDTFCRITDASIGSDHIFCHDDIDTAWHHTS